MPKESTNEEEWELPLDQLGEHRLPLAASEGPSNSCKSYERVIPIRALGTTQEFDHLLIEQRLAATSTKSSRESSGFETGEVPRVFVDSNRDLPHLAQRRTEVKEESNDQYHDGELDIFDLYNACNGVVLEDGTLDIHKVEELSSEELEVLDIVKLRTIWVHASNCSECENIIGTLNSIRTSSQEKQ